MGSPSVSSYVPIDNPPCSLLLGGIPPCVANGSPVTRELLGALRIHTTRHVNGNVCQGEVKPLPPIYVGVNSTNSDKRRAINRFVRWAYGKLKTRSFVVLINN